MPVPAGSSPDPMLYLFTLPELDAWVGASLPEATGLLARELVTSLFRIEVGGDRWDALTDLSPLKPVALDVARRMVRNLDGRRSTSRSLDDYSTTVTYATESLNAEILTEEDVARIWAALGVRRAGAFTIRPGAPAAVRRGC